MKASETKAVYCLSCPMTDVVRYVGSTYDPQRRLYQHVKLRQGSPSKLAWIDSLREQNLTPNMRILASVAQPFATEIEQAWIENFRRDGAPLFNRGPYRGGNKPSAGKNLDKLPRNTLDT